MAVKANQNAMAEVFKGRALLYVPCVSDEDLTLIPLKFSYIQVVCREIHVSFTEELSVRRVALTPIMVNGKHISELFNGLRSPALVHVDSSCDFRFIDPKDPRDGETFQATLLWDYSIIPALASQPVPPSQVPNTDAVDDVLQQVDISSAGHCNCGKMPNVPYCLVSFSTYCDPLEGEGDGGEGDDEVGSESDEEDTSEQDSEHEDDEDEIMTYAEEFKVVGSSYERPYQQAFSICAFLRTEKKEPPLEVVHEPDNIKDKNALCFQVKHLEKKYDMGYCPLVKVPKLDTRKLAPAVLQSSAFESLQDLFSIDTEFN